MLLALLPLPGVLLAQPASATQAPVAFSSGALPTWQTSGIAWAVAQSQGKVFVGGSFTSIRPPGAAAGNSETPRSLFATFDAATGNPTSCAPSFTLPADPANATIRSLDVSPDGSTLYVGGYFSNVNGVALQHLVAIDIASCTLIQSFRTAPNGLVDAIDATSTDVYYGGGFTSVAGQTRSHAAAASAVGTATPGALTAWAPSFDSTVAAVAVRPDNGAVVAGGTFDLVNGQDSHALVVVDTAGAIVHAFPVGYIHPTSTVKAIAVDASGFYTGNEGTGGGVFDGRLAVNWDYSERWRDTCLGATQTVALYQGVMYSGSHAHDCSSEGWFSDGPRHHFLAESTDAGAIQPWFPDTDDGLGEGIGPRALVVAPSGGTDYLWSAGEFLAVNGVQQQGLTRFATGPDPVGPSAPVVTVSSPRPGQSRIAWRTSIDTDDSLLTYKVYRDNLATPVFTTTASSFFWMRPQLSFTDTGLAPGSVHTYKVSANDGTNTSTAAIRTITIAGAASPYAERVLSDNASSLWRYDETNDLVLSDATDNGNNATIRAGATYGRTPAAIAGDPSKALGLSGSSSYLYGEVLTAAPATFTAETWIKTSTTSGGKIIGFGNKQQISSSTYDRHIYMANDGTLLFGVTAAATTTVRSTRAYNDNQWHHVAATEDSSGISLYVDGVRVGHDNTVGTRFYNGYWRVGGDSLGSNWAGQPSSAYFAGQVDETAIYPYALSASTVADHYVLAGGSLPAGARGPSDFYGATTYGLDPFLFWRLNETSGSNLADASNSGNTGTIGNGVTLGVNGALPGSSAMALDGSSSGLLSQSNRSTAPQLVTEVAWFKTNTNKGGKIIGFGDRRTGNSGNYDRQIWMRDDGKLSYGVYYPSNGGTVVLTTPNSYNDGSYHQVAATRNDSGMALYVDGQLIASNNQTGAAQVYNAYVRVGGDTLSSWNANSTNNYFNGTVDEVAVWAQALTPAQVSAVWSASRSSGTDLAPPTVPTGPTATVGTSGVTLGWAASSDNVGVQGYTVHRSSTSGFTPDAGNAVATVSTPGYVDPGVPGLWYYKLVAFDAAGNRSTASNQVSAYLLDTQAPTAPGNLVATATTTTIALGWDASTDNVGVVDYTVHRSTTAGFTPSASNAIASVPSPGYTDSTPPAVRAYYRVVARDAAGNASPLSSEVNGLAADTTAPTVPTGLTASVAGKTVSLAWTASTDDTAVTGYDVYRSVTQGATPVPAALVGSSTVASFTESNVPEGSWYYRVVAKDARNNRSDGSVDAAAVLDAQTQVITVAPTADALVNAGAATTNFGTNATLTSRGTPGAVAYLRFPLPAAPAGKTLVGAVLKYRTTTDTTAGSADAHRIGTAADTWAESTVTWNNRPALTSTVLGSVAAGSKYNTPYTSALDPSGLAPLLGAPATLAVSGSGSDSMSFWSRETPTVANRPSLVLTFSPSNDASPPSTPTNLVGSAAGPTVTLSWSASSDNVAVTGYDVHRSSVADFTPSAATLVANVPDKAFTEIRSTGVWYYAVVAKDAAGNASPPTANVPVSTNDSTAPTAPADVTASAAAGTVTVSWTASTDDVGVRGYDVYRSATPGEVPGPATLVGSPTGTTFSESRSSGTWYYQVVASDDAGNRSAPSTEASVLIGDSEAPTAPTDLQATTTGGRPALTWTASTDNVAVTGYEVHRSTSATFTPSAATRIATVTSTDYVDGVLPGGSYTYLVVALDGAGNASAPSGPATTTVSAPQTITVVPIADASGNAGAPSTNYGTSVSLASRGTPGAAAYLRFAIPAAPAGKSLVSATLRLRTTTDTTSGSADAQTVSIASDTWTESTLTWNNRPAITGPALSSLTGATAYNTPYETGLSASGLSPLLGTQATLSVAGTANDSLYFYSKEQGTAASRPQLILTFA
jgi:hypothetical protein